MSLLKWIMKQYWRLGTIRAWLSLGLAMLVLGRLYYGYVPFLQDLGFFGAIFLGAFFILVFMGLGWLYDTKTKMWAPQIQTIVERNPYSYVPAPRNHFLHYPAVYVFVLIVRGMMQKAKLDSQMVSDFQRYMAYYFTRKPVKSDIISAESLAEAFSQEHPFVRNDSNDSSSVSMVGKIKLAFQVQITRLNWIQSLTGLAQDVLNLTAFYVVFLLPEMSPEQTVPVDSLLLGIVIIAIPLFFCLAGLGWVYDRKLEGWSPERVIRVERNPYSYIPRPSYFIKLIPVLYCLLDLLQKLAPVMDIDIVRIRNIIEHLNQYNGLSVKKDEDMEKARRLGESYNNLFQIHDMEKMKK